MPPLIGHITEFCFEASYAVALALELVNLFWPRPVQRLLSLGFGSAGLLAHSLFVLVQPLPLETPYGALIFLAWILAVFYLYGSIHHRQVAWGLFVLPIVLGLVVLARLFPNSPNSSRIWQVFDQNGRQIWPWLHGILLLLAAVGVCVGFVASLMYLVQLQRLKAKVPPGRGIRLLSLERLETMNRRAIAIAFPLLTAGLLVGLGMLTQADEPLDWKSPKVLSTAGLWLVFAILLYLRHGVHAAGRALALLTIVAFSVMLLALASSHRFAEGGPP